MSRCWGTFSRSGGCRVSESGIYRILNTVDEKVYIGQSQDIPARLSKHARTLRLGKHSNPYLQAAWDKHGESAFLFERVMIVEDLGCLDSAEAGWFYLSGCCNRKYGYNIATDPQAARRGVPHSPAAKAKMSEARAGKPGRPHTAASRAKISAAHSGKPGHQQSEATRMKLRAIFSGRKFSDETRARMSAAASSRKRSPHSAKTRARMRESALRRWAK